MELDFAQQWQILCIEVRLQWKLRVYLLNFGFCSKTSTESLLLGKNDWQFFGESCIDDGHFQTLVFSTCYKEEFTCNNGECISLELVCDGVFHCKDIYSKNASSTYILLSNVCFTLATLTEKIKEAIEVIFGTHAIRKYIFKALCDDVIVEWRCPGLVRRGRLPNYFVSGKLRQTHGTIYCG